MTLYDNRRVVAVYCRSANCNPVTPLLLFVVDLLYNFFLQSTFDESLTDSTLCCPSVAAELLVIIYTNITFMQSTLVCWNGTLGAILDC